ncbi:MAG TPA: hypothetical protein VNL74_09740 [Methylococcus sp.]|nr:hypothetical protein [Methylococcus sp.]
MRDLIRWNFHASVWLSILGAIRVIQDANLVLSDTEDLSDPLKNNLLFIAAYLGLSQLVLWFLRYSRDGFFEALLMGGQFLLLAGGLQIYAWVNDLPLQNPPLIAIFYVGISHCLYPLARSRGKAGKRVK